MSPLRTLPPAGTVIPFPLLLKGLLGALRPGDARARLAHEIQQLYGVREVHLLNSGRSVLTVLLQAMKEARPERTEVILPGYTCYSVAAAAVRVGLKVRPVDIDPDTFDYDPAALEAVDTSNTLALITANLFGIPN
ncbi:MAG: aminotransferase DegT, partial [Gemmatimonadales bacterium]